jgi:small subunit ribosomal protein S8
MSTHDPISDLITRIRNAQMRSKSKVSTPGSRMRASVLEVLKSEGYIRGYASVEHASGRSELEIELKYFDGEPVIREIERVSKPGRRVYASVKNLPRVNNGLGISVLSTPKGIMATKRATRTWAAKFSSRCSSAHSAKVGTGFATRMRTSF